MNKICAKIASVCLSAAMLTSALTCNFMTVDSFAKNNTISAESTTKLIKNSTFDNGTSKWGTYLAGGGEATLTSKDGKLAYKIDKVGTLNYGVQLFYDIIPLYKNGEYHLTFDISCDTDRIVEVMLQQNGGTYQSYTWKKLNLTGNTQKVDIKFTMEAETDEFSKLVFNCGNQKEEVGPHTIYLDNVYLELVDDSKVDYSKFVKEEATVLTNQVGYLPDAKKTAVFRGNDVKDKFYVVDAATDKTVYTGDVTDKTENTSGGETDWYGDFSSVKTPGKYYIKTGEKSKSYPFTIGTDVYNSLMDESLYMFYLQRCGCEVKDNNGAGHDVCHADKATIFGTQTKIDVSGGWHDAGDYGRYIVPAAKAVADLLLAYQVSPSLFSDKVGIPESNNGIPDVLDEVRYELEWMLKMQDKSSGGVYHKVTCANFPGFVMPDKETEELIVTPVSTTATADFCASMAMAYEFYLDIDKDFANKCLDAAKSAWSYLEKNPNFIFENPKGIVTGEYGDKTDSDERYWAAAQLYKATCDSKYGSAFESMVAKGVQSGMDWATVGAYGNIAYLTMNQAVSDKTETDLSAKSDSDIVKKIKAALIEEADDMLSTAKASAYDTAISSYAWGSNMTISNCGALLYFVSTFDKTKNYTEVANEQLNYLLGRNACGTCFVTGFGTVSPLHPHHRPSMNMKAPVKGMLVGGVNSALEDSAALALLEDAPKTKCYLDNDQSYSTNEITIYWNSPFIYLLADVLTDSAKEPSKEEPKVTTVSETTVTTTSETSVSATTTTKKTETSASETTVSETSVTSASETTVTPNTIPQEKVTESTGIFETPKKDPEPVNYGDLDGNGIVEITDLTSLSLYLLGDMTFNEKQKLAADVTGDGKVNLADLPHLRQYLMEENVKLGPKK